MLWKYSEMGTIMSKKTVAIGTYAAVLHALGGMDKEFEQIAKDDEFGKKLQDLNLSSRRRAKRSK